MNASDRNFGTASWALFPNDSAAVISPAASFVVSKKLASSSQPIFPTPLRRMWTHCRMMSILEENQNCDLALLRRPLVIWFRAERRSQPDLARCLQRTHRDQHDRFRRQYDKGS